MEIDSVWLDWNGANVSICRVAASCVGEQATRHGDRQLVVADLVGLVGLRSACHPGQVACDAGVTERDYRFRRLHNKRETACSRVNYRAAI